MPQEAHPQPPAAGKDLASDPSGENIQGGAGATRYQRLAALAATYATSFMEHRAHCAAQAQDLLQAAYLYFEAPEGSIRLLTLGEDLSPTPMQGKFTLLQGRDALWYFALAIKLEGSQLGFSEATVTLGLKRDEDELVVRMRSDHRTVASDPRRWTRMLQNLEGALIEHYQRSPSQPRKPIGFSSI